MIAQQNMGAEGAVGSGEWPSPDATPTGPSPGTTPEGAQDASRREQAPPMPPPAGTASQPELQQDASSAGDRGPTRTADTAAGREGPHHPPESFKPVLDADPISGGSQAVPDLEEDAPQGEP